jgi:hypothetical protein
MVRKQRASQRSAARKSTARKHRAGRCQRIASGTSRSTDWECPRCQQWFAKRRNGPDNHLRFCLKRPSSSAKETHAEYVPSPNIPKSLSTTGDSSSGCFGSDLDGSETSDMDSDATPNPLVRTRGTQQARCRGFEDCDGTV